jgi:hypothetical protein
MPFQPVNFNLVETARAAQSDAMQKQQFEINKTLSGLKIQQEQIATNLVQYQNDKGQLIAAADNAAIVSGEEATQSKQRTEKQGLDIQQQKKVNPLIFRSLVAETEAKEYATQDKLTGLQSLVDSLESLGKVQKYMQDLMEQGAYELSGKVYDKLKSFAESGNAPKQLLALVEQMNPRDPKNIAAKQEAQTKKMQQQAEDKATQEFTMRSQLWDKIDEIKDNPEKQSTLFRTLFASESPGVQNHMMKLFESSRPLQDVKIPSTPEEFRQRLATPLGEFSKDDLKKLTPAQYKNHIAKTLGANAGTDSWDKFILPVLDGIELDLTTKGLTPEQAKQARTLYARNLDTLLSGKLNRDGDRPYFSYDKDTHEQALRDLIKLDMSTNQGKLSPVTGLAMGMVFNSTENMQRTVNKIQPGIAQKPGFNWNIFN